MPILTMSIASENTSRVLDGIQTGLTSRVLDVIPLFRPGSVSSGSPS